MKRNIYIYIYIYAGDEWKFDQRKVVVIVRALYKLKASVLVSSFGPASKDPKLTHYGMV